MLTVNTKLHRYVRAMDGLADSTLQTLEAEGAANDADVGDPGAKVPGSLSRRLARTRRNRPLRAGGWIVRTW